MRRCFRLTATLLACVILIVGTAQSACCDPGKPASGRDSKFLASLSNDEIAILKNREKQRPELLDIKAGEGTLELIIATLVVAMAIVGVLALAGSNVEKWKNL